jgi:signal transduction histidine kinase/ActR/RegA family two-component response regulator
MATYQDGNPGSLQRSQQEGAEAVQADVREQRLRDEIAALQHEVRGLRKAVQDRDSLEGMVAQLREANENLVFATVNAQGLRDDAEAASRRQNEFLAMLAHELRNPLAPISMAAALLERFPDASSKLLNLTQVIGRQVDHMAHLLDDLLDAARISSGKIILAVQPVLLAEIIAQAVETVQPRIDERKQHLMIDVPAEAIITDGDKVRLTQVFSNLLGNASKYTGDFGDISLSAALDGADVVIRVTDNGAGIAREVIPHIFDLFTQGPRSLARSEGGLGVGLNVVRNLVSMHGGKVEASSAGLGGGSQFTVTLPVSQQTRAASAKVEHANAVGARRKVLLIEDNIDACTTLQNFLATEGHAVSTAFDGAAGLRAAIDGEYDVVICDIGLPGLDGFDVIRSLRQSASGVQPYAIALSGYGQDEDRSRAIEAGFDHYLVKPVSPNTLLALISTGTRSPPP